MSWIDRANGSQALVKTEAKGQVEQKELEDNG
jgi:hypothetical protein